MSASRVGHATRMLGSTGVELPVIGLGGAAYVITPLWRRAQIMWTLQ